MRTNWDYFQSGYMSLYTCIVFKMPNLRTHGTWVYRRSVEVRGHSYSMFEDSVILLKSLLVVQIEKKNSFITYSNVQAIWAKWRPLFITFGGQWTSVMTSRGCQWPLLSFPGHYRPFREEKSVRILHKDWKYNRGEMEAAGGQCRPMQPLGGY